MKRSAALVSYQSSDDERPEKPQAPPKPKKLPRLHTSLQIEVPVDNPTLHQGRVRTTQHREGYFAAYVYVPLVLDKGSLLHKLLLKVYASANDVVPSLHPIGILDVNASSSQLNGGEGSTGGRRKHELHISLTRPTYLNAHQRDEFKRAVRTVAKSQPGFPASFATFAELTNDERTRTFLTIEVGAGHAELKAMSDALVPTLRSFRQKKFYAEPRFHVSIAWALLDRSQSSTAPPEVNPADTEPDLKPALHSPPPETADGKLMSQFPTIPSFPASLIPDLIAKYGTTMSSRQVGAFNVEELCVRIGKDVARFSLQS